MTRDLEFGVTGSIIARGNGSDSDHAVNGSEARARWGLAIGLAFLFSTGCAARSGPGAAGGSFRGRCGLGGFTPSASEHVIVELDKPLRVRTVEGIVTSQAGDWPEGVSVLFEIRPMAEAPSRPRGVRTDRRGHFEIPGVPAGEYCFKATSEGWQSVTGVIVVSPTADPDSRVNVEMPLGV